MSTELKKIIIHGVAAIIILNATAAIAMYLKDKDEKQKKFEKAMKDIEEATNHTIEEYDKSVEMLEQIKKKTDEAIKNDIRKKFDEAVKNNTDKTNNMLN